MKRVISNLLTSMEKAPNGRYPTRNLDAFTADSFVRTVNQLRGKVTLLFIARQLPRRLKVDEVLQFAAGAEGQLRAHLRVINEGKTTL